MEAARALLGDARRMVAFTGAGISTGDRIMAIDGQLLGADGPGPLLAGAAGKPVELTIAPHGGGRWRRVYPATGFGDGS